MHRDGYMEDHMMHEHGEIHDVPVNVERGEEIDTLTAPADTNLNPAVDEAMEGPDYARGQREEGDVALPEREAGDFARGLDDRMDLDKAEHPDYARGQREDEHSSYVPGLDVAGSEEQEEPDYARGQRDMGEDVVE